MKKRVFPADLEAYDEVNAFAEEVLESFGVNIRNITPILIAIEEIFVNIARYAYPEGDGEAEICISIKDGKCVVRFQDSGIPFNPLEKEEPNIQNSADERKIGGLGIFMVKKSMDNIKYELKNNKNVLTIEKIINTSNYYNVD